MPALLLGRATILLGDDIPLTMRFIALLACCGLLCGCGSNNSNCTYTMSYTASPATATKDHLAAAPDNQQQFTAQVVATPPAGCTASGYTAPAYAVWTSTNPTSISISNASDSTNGLATCNSSTGGPVTLTATTGSSGDAVTATTQLTCQ